MACHKAATLQKSGGGSSPKLCQSFYKKKTKVWGMDFSEVGAEFGSCGHRWKGKHTEEMQNRTLKNTNAATTKTPMPTRENPIACTPDVAAAQCLHT